METLRTARVWALAAAALLATSVAAPAQVWEVGSQRLGLFLGPQAGAGFGAAVALGDFDGDGKDDVVVGSPFRDGVGGVDSGAFTIYLGGAHRTLTLAVMIEPGEVDDARAGTALAAGDFDADGRDEIAIGEPGRDNGPQAGSGWVVIYGFANGEWTWDKILTQLDTSDPPEVGDRFGEALATGDFNGDGYADLAVGSPSEDKGALVDAGVVQVFYGGPAGLRTDDDQTLFSPNASAGERFAQALAAGDFDGDGYADLAVGAPNRTVATAPHAGAVEIYYGSGFNLPSTPQVIDDGDFPLSAAGAGDLFGWSLAARDFQPRSNLCIFVPGHCFDDLAIGVPGQLLSMTAGAGKVMVAYGSAAALDPATSTYLQPASVGASAEAQDGFGSVLAAGRLDSAFRGAGDLAIGTPGEDYYATDDGVVHLLFGASGGLNAGPPSELVPQRPGFATAPAAASDRFGTALAIGDLDGDGWGDLVVGIPSKGPNGSGAVLVLYGALFADGFESNGTAMWGP